jgi:hypothetical protein
MACTICNFENYSILGWDSDVGVEKLKKISFIPATHFVLSHIVQFIRHAL